MKSYKYTDYFENEVLRKRAYLKKEWCIDVIENYEHMEKQEDNRYLRVITLEDQLTIHNAFPDRRFSL